MNMKYIDPISGEPCQLKPRPLTDKERATFTLGKQFLHWPTEAIVEIEGYEWRYTSDGGRTEEFLKVKYIKPPQSNISLATTYVGPHQLKRVWR